MINLNKCSLSRFILENFSFKVNIYNTIHYTKKHYINVQTKFFFKYNFGLELHSINSKA